MFAKNVLPLHRNSKKVATATPKKLHKKSNKNQKLVQR